MKLSEILKDWPEKKERGLYCDPNSPSFDDAVNADFNISAFNTALTSCDREIDREALAILIMEINFESYGFSHEEVAYKTTDKIISNMSTWLRERNIL